MEQNDKSRMIKIQIGLIFFMIISDTRATFLTSVSREITKLMKPKSGSVQVVPLQNDLEKDENVKTEEEFEIALITERLGFVYCNIKQEPYIGRFVKKYLNMSEGHSASLQTLIPRRLAQDEMLSAIKACQNYLIDEVLWDNGLQLDIIDENIKLVGVVERVVQFDYFSAKPYTFAALQCPVRVKSRFDNKLRTIFFSALGKRDDEIKVTDEENADGQRKKNVDGVGRPFYVFADYTQLDKSKFKILMHTVQQDPKIFFADGTPPRVEGIRSRMNDNPQKCPIHLHVKPERFNDGYRLFGKDAEAAFLTEKSQFFNKSYAPGIINRFLDTLLEMKKGYEILSYHEWVSKFIRDQSGDLSVSGTNIRFNCPKYVNGAESLQKYRPVLEANDRSNFLKPMNIEIRLKITGKSLKRCFYQCPVTFTGEKHWGKAMVNIIPVVYRSSENCQEHAFYYIVVNENTSTEHRDFFLSRVDEPAKVQPAKRVGVQNPVESVESDSGVEPGSRSVGGVESIESGEPDAVGRFVTGGTTVGGSERVGDVEPLKSIDPEAEANPNSSGELSESLRRSVAYMHDEENEGDISGMSGSIGISGDLQRGAT